MGLSQAVHQHRGAAMPTDQMLALPGDALDQLAGKLLAEARLQDAPKPLSKPIDAADDDIGANLLAWLLDAYQDTLAEDDD